MTETDTRRRRSNSITEYSQIFSQNAPKPSSFIGQKRHPSLSMRHDRTTSIGQLGLNVSALAQTSDESAIDDSEPMSPPNSTSFMAKAQRSQTTDTVGLARRLSQGARAIMYNGNRLRGDSVTSNERPMSSRTFSHGSSMSQSPGSLSEQPLPEPAPARSTSDGAKIKRRLSPTGERMLRGELTFH